MSLDLKAVRERAEKATPGPWVDDVTEINQHWSVAGELEAQKTIVGLEECGSPYNPWQRLVLEEADRAFIAHARSDIPALLERIEEMERNAWPCHRAGCTTPATYNFMGSKCLWCWAHCPGTCYVSSRAAEQAIEALMERVRVLEEAASHAKWVIGHFNEPGAESITLAVGLVQMVAQAQEKLSRALSPERMPSDG